MYLFILKLSEEGFGPYPYWNLNLLLLQRWVGSLNSIKIIVLQFVIFNMNVFYNRLIYF